MEALNQARDRMKQQNAFIGEPAVEIPMDDLTTYRDANGEWHVIIGMDKLIHLVDRVIRG